MQDMKRFWQKAIPIILVVFSLGAGIYIRFSRPYEYNGVVYQNPVPAPAVELNGTKGEFSLEDYSDKVVMLFFGYTSCPDICPSTMSDLKWVMDYLGDKADRVQVVFVTVDPERDTVEKLGSYVTLFNPSFIGLSGTEEELQPIWNGYGVFREIDNESDSMAGYLVSHTSRIYLVDPQGRLLITYGFGTAPEEITEDLVHVLGNSTK